MKTICPSSWHTSEVTYLQEPTILSNNNVIIIQEYWNTGAGGGIRTHEPLRDEVPQSIDTSERRVCKPSL